MRGSQPAAGASKPPVTGTMTVKYGDKVVCVMTVKAGKGSCDVDTARYKPGALKFVATYSGGGGYKGSTGSATLHLKNAG